MTTWTKLPATIGSTGWMRRRDDVEDFAHKDGTLYICPGHLARIFSVRLKTATAVRITLYREPREGSAELRIGLCNPGCCVVIDSLKVTGAIREIYARSAWPAVKRLHAWLKSRGGVFTVHAVLEVRR
jgi:hypothetical protein